MNHVANNSAAPVRLIPQAEALALLPANLASMHNILPLRTMGGSLVCAGPGPFDLNLLTQLQFQLQKRLTLVKVPQDLFTEAFERQYGTRLVPQAPALLDLLCGEKPEITDREIHTNLEFASQPCRTVAFLGAKGGVGTTSVAANLSVHLAQIGNKVGLLDAHFANPTAHIALGSKPKSTLRDLSRKISTPWAALSMGSAGVRVLAGEPGSDLRLDHTELHDLGASPSQFADHFDFWLIDLGSEMSDLQMTYALRSDQVVIVTTTEPTSLHNALVQAKLICDSNPYATPQLLFNEAASAGEAKKAFLKVRSMLGHDRISFAGSIPASKHMSKSWAVRTPLALFRPKDSAMTQLKQAFGSLTKPHMARAAQPSSQGVNQAI
ncbi:MAG: P-loop NTPase [Fimbriimonadaceae bacterium]|nr:MAG: P-loop NTPase [Fimbriimonadaceae bacterium]